MSPSRFAPVAGLARAWHPEPGIAVTLVATALAVATGRPAAGVAAVSAAVLSGQLAVGWLNDFLDAERDIAVGRADKPVAAGTVPRRVVRDAAVLAGLACVPLSLLSGVTAGLVHLVGVAAALAYDVGVKATAASALPYAVAFGALPAFVVLGLPGHPAPPWWLVVGGALLGCAAHFANVLPDLGDDLAAGVRGLPHRLGPAGSRVAASGLLLAASLVLALGPGGGPTPFAVAALPVAVAALAVGQVLGRGPGSRAAFRAVMVAAGVDVLLLLAAGPTLVRR
ncbi:UbiA family prenyltransferase [Gandjariella thermophila]|uniref:UbiA family prenyltransferase n=1 Tax=Gandjariella thermophila TaxID=1931992 RepID=UPI001CEF73EC|nr:UbiA family prenyltransferase [Gandjariella thermophila]